MTHALLNFSAANDDIRPPSAVHSDNQPSRCRNFRRAEARRAQRRQGAIAIAFHHLTPGAEPDPRWKKLSVFSCRANCGHCRNARFNRRSSGLGRLTPAELRNLENFSYSMNHLSPEDFEPELLEQAA